MYKPLPDNVRLARSPIHGFGLFAATDIPENTVLGITHVSHYLFTHGWIRTPLGGYCNHSDEPNCVLQNHFLDSVTVGTTAIHGMINEDRTKSAKKAKPCTFSKVKKDISKVLKTLRDVKENEELTCFYTIWDIEEIKNHK
jgi:hypothetical protein